MKNEVLYLNSPIFLQQLFLNLKGYQIAKRRYGKQFHHWLSELKKENIQNINHDELYRFLQEANKTPFWNAQFTKFKLNINKANDLTYEILKLPMLTKQEVKVNI